MSNVIEFGESAKGGVGFGGSSKSGIEFTYYGHDGELLARSGFSPISGVALDDDSYKKLAVSALSMAAHAAADHKVVSDVMSQVASVGVNKGGGGSVLELDREYVKSLEGLDDLYCTYREGMESLDKMTLDELDSYYDVILLELEAKRKAVHDTPFSGEGVGREFSLAELGDRLNSDLAFAFSQKRSAKLFSLMHSLAVSPANALVEYDKNVKEPYERIDDLFKLGLSYPV